MINLYKEFKELREIERVVKATSSIIKPSLVVEEMTSEVLVFLYNAEYLQTYTSKEEYLNVLAEVSWIIRKLRNKAEIREIKSYLETKQYKEGEHESNNNKHNG